MIAHDRCSNSHAPELDSGRDDETGAAGNNAYGSSPKAQRGDPLQLIQ
jgi:hypothetical protein